MQKLDQKVRIRLFGTLVSNINWIRKLSLYSGWLLFPSSHTR